MRMSRISATYQKDCENESDYLIGIIADLRDFVDHEVVSEEMGWDISAELVAGPEHVLIYIAHYIEILERRLEELK